MTTSNFVHVFSNSKTYEGHNDGVVFHNVPKILEKKSQNKAFRLSRRAKAPFFLIINSKKVSVAVKYKWRYKYLLPNEVALLLVKNSKSINNLVVGNLTSKIVIDSWKKTKPAKTGIVVDLSADLQVRDGDKDITTSFIIDVFKSIYDADQNPYSQLLSTWDDFGIYRQKTFRRALSSKMSNKLITRLKTYQKGYVIGDKKIDSIEKINPKEIKVSFIDNSFFTVTKVKAGVDVTVINHGSIGVNLEHMISFEKVVEGFIIDNSEEFEDKKFTWKAFIKYSIFVMLIIASFVLVFELIYKSSSSRSLYTLAGAIVNKTNRLIWFSILSWTVIARIIGAWQLKRMLSMQNENVKIRHIFISSLMSSVISFITPFAVGGDAIGYWYLRRKGFARGALIAAFISNTLLYQVKFTIQTIILFGVGYPIYKEIFESTEPQAHAAFIVFIIGASWTIFATIMIFSLVLWRQFQEVIIKLAVRLLEWTRFVNLEDPDGLIAKYQFEFKQMRTGMKIVWGKFWFAMELLLYSLAPLFLDPFAIILFFNGTIKHETFGVNGYMGYVVISDLVNTANSMSITPGGSITQEWLTVTTKQLIFNTNVVGGASSKDVASSVDFTYKMLYSWPWLLFSTMVIPTIIILENKRKRVNLLNKNLLLNNKEAKYKIKIKKYIALIWVAVIIIFVTYFFVIFPHF